MDVTSAGVDKIFLPSLTKRHVLDSVPHFPASGPPQHMNRIFVRTTDLHFLPPCIPVHSLQDSVMEHFGTVALKPSLYEMRIMLVILHSPLMLPPP